VGELIEADEVELRGLVLGNVLLALEVPKPDSAAFLRELPDMSGAIVAPG
jgi:hypothetical protein